LIIFGTMLAAEVSRMAALYYC
jgi:hypothetical protein